jgi:hypothetical protein
VNAFVSCVGNTGQNLVAAAQGKPAERSIVP